MQRNNDHKHWLSPGDMIANEVAERLEHLNSAKPDWYYGLYIDKVSGTTFAAAIPPSIHATRENKDKYHPISEWMKYIQ